MRNLILFFFVTFTVAVHAETKLIPFRQKQNWGYADTTGSIQIPCKFQSASLFTRNFAIVKELVKFGVIDRKGQYVVKATYDSIAFSFSGNKLFFRVFSGGNFGFLDSTGKPTALPVYKDDVLKVLYCDGNFSDGLFPVVKNGKAGFIDEKGRLVIPCRYDQCMSFSCRRAIVVRNNLQYVIDPNGKETPLPMEYSSILQFHEGLASVSARKCTQDVCWGAVDTNLRLVIPTNFQSELNFKNGIAITMLGNFYTFVDKTGKNLVTEEYCYMHEFEGSHTLAFKCNNVGPQKGFVLDREMKVIAGLESASTIGTFGDGLICGSNTGYGPNSVGYMDTTGKFVIAPKFAMGFRFHGERTWVKVDEKWGMIDTKGNFVLQPEFALGDLASKMIQYADGTTLLFFTHASVVKSGYVDRSGRKYWED